MNSFGRESSYSYSNNLTDMATGSISRLLQDDEVLKENQTVEKTFMGERAVDSMALQEEGVIKYVTTAFTEVCRKIDDLHRIIESHSEISHIAEKKDNLDSILIEEEPEEVGWLERLKEIIYGKEVYKNRPESSKEVEHESIEREHARQGCKSEDIVQSAVDIAEKAGLKAYMGKLKESEEVKHEKARAHNAEKALKETQEKLEKCKGLLKLRKKEISEIKSSFNLGTPAEGHLAKLATTVAVQVSRILLLLGLPDGMEELHQEISAGETRKLTGSFAEIEKAFRDAMQRERELFKRAQKEKEEIRSQIKTLRDEIEIGKKSNEELIKEAEKIKNEKDALINKQKLVIKLLKSKITQNTVQEINREQTERIVHVQNSLKNKERTKVEEELEERIERIKEKLDTMKNKSDPLYKIYLEDLEDSKRRLADFMQI